MSAKKYNSIKCWPHCLHVVQKTSILNLCYLKMNLSLPWQGNNNGFNNSYYLADMKQLITFLFIAVGFVAQAQVKLTDNAEISIITCGPYQGELYSAFGHSAVRVY